MANFGHKTASDNRDGIQVRVGQHWQSMDKRRPARSCEVVGIDGGVATLQEFERDRPSEGLLQALKSPDAKVAAWAAKWVPEPVKVHIDRMHAHSTGWRLLS
jgi:hypothetical protein